MSTELTDELRRRGLQVDEVAGSLNVRKGSGPLAHSVNIDPTAMVDWLSSRGDDTRRSDVASWGSGVETTLLEPRHSKARAWTFVESAGSIFPTVEGAAFARGVEDATGGEPAWVTPLDGEELVFGWILRLGRGVRPLTAAHVADWGATHDRIVSAGRSLLFHATRHADWRPTELPDVLELKTGDGHDAARLLVAADVFFSEVDANWRFATPHPDILLAVKHADSVGRLTEAARIRAETADYPLGSQIWRITPAGPQVDR